jgi:iron complex outermembrane recepter protein
MSRLLQWPGTAVRIRHDVKFDLNGNGVVDGKDKDLDLPRAAEWTYSFGLNVDTDLGDHGE